MEGKGNGGMSELQNTINTAVSFSLICSVSYSSVTAGMHTHMHSYISPNGDELFLSLVLPDLGAASRMNPKINSNLHFT